MANNRSKNHSEFGGGPGSPGRHEDGSSIPLSPGQRARILRQMAIRDVADPNVPRTEQVTRGNDETAALSRPYQPDVNKIAELDEKTNRYSREVDYGETAS